MNAIAINNLTVSIDNKIVIKNLNMTIPHGEFHVLMGKNGAGKSSLAKAIIGYPDTKIISGDIIFNGKIISNLPMHEISKFGIFLSFQNPIDIPGVSIANFIRSAMNAHGKILSTTEFYKLLYKNM